MTASTRQVAIVVLTLVAASRVPFATADDAKREPGTFAARISPFLAVRCLKCHGPRDFKGEVSLHDLSDDLAAGRDVERWEAVLEMLESGAMPPAEAPQPTAAERKAVVEWIAGELRRFVTQANRARPAVATRRLTNVEYRNTMRDLLGFELNLVDNLPEDPVKPYRFNNTAEFMLLGPEQMDRYRENARRAMASVLVDPGEPKVHRTVRRWEATDPVERGMQLDEIGVYGNRRGSPAGGLRLQSWPKTGEYLIRVEAAAILPPGAEEVPLRLLMGYDIGHNLAMLQVRPVGTVHLRNSVDAMRVVEFRGRIENHPVQPGTVTERGVEPPTMTITPQNLYDDGELNDHLSGFDTSWNLSAPRVVVRSIEFEAPTTGVWPPEHHTRILFDSPLRRDDPRAYVEEVLRRFVSRAFRRPATNDEVDRFARIHAVFAEESDTLEESMRETLATVLAAPQFLYHAVGGREDANRRYELASRMSYFLWASMPDAELTELAASGELDDPAVIGRQVERLLADGRSRDFVENFAKQWLGIEKAKTIAINTNLFPRFLYLVHLGERRGTEVPYRPTIRDYMLEETVGFVGELIRRNASVLNLVDSDFAYLNQPLAAHYGVPGVQGLELRPVPIRPEHRLGGLLTQGSVLVGNSTGSAPHPIYRAVWLREAILGDEVKPPPAEVPALADTAGESAEKAVTIKALLERHHREQRCNDCHSRLDPWGIPFEQYNAVGRFQPKVPTEGTRVRGFDAKLDGDLAGYRRYLDQIATVEVQADSRVPGGPNVDGMRELKDHLLRDRSDDVAENVVRRLLAYGLGRELTYRDRFVVESLLDRSKANGHGLRDMIVSICQTELFRGTNPADR